MTFSIKKKTLRKIVSSLTMFATVVSMSGMMALSTVVAADAVADGALIKSDATNSDGTPTYESLDIYIVKIVGTKQFKRLVLNPTVFESYGHLNYGDVQTITQAEMDTYTTSSLVRVDTDPDEKVYAMAPDGDIGSKSWVNLTTTQFVDEASSDADSIYTINSVDGGNYTTVGDVTTVTELTDFYSTGDLPDVTPVPADGGLAIALSAETPEAQTIVAAADGILMTKAVFSATEGDVVVTGMSLKRVGLGDYTDLAKVWLVVDGARRGSSKSINSSDEASLLFSSDTKKVTIADGTSKIFEIWAQTEDTGEGGNMDAISIEAVTTDSTVSGLPVAGNTMSMTSITASDITFTDVAVGSDVNIGDTQVEVSKIKITNDEANEDAIVRGMVFKSNTGTSTRVGPSEVSNFTLYDYAGNVVAGPVSMDADYYVRFTLDSPFTIEKGGSKNETFAVKADILAGPGYDINLDVEYTYDLDIIGGTNGYSTDNNDSFADATEVSIADAALSVNVDTENNPSTRTMIDNTDNIVLLAGNFRADQGDVTISQFKVLLTGTGMADAEYVNLKFYADGVLVGEDSTVAFVATPTDETELFTFDEEIPVSGTVPFKVTIDAESGITADDWIRAEVAGTNITATRDSDGTGISETGTATGNKVTFGTATVQVTGSPSAPSVTRVKGSAGIIFGAFDIAVGTASDVVLKSIKVNYMGDNGSSEQTADQNDLQNITLLKSDMTEWTSVENLNSSEQLTFSGLNKSLTAGATMRFYVKADIASTISDADITRVWLEVIEVLADDVEGDAISVTDNGSTPAVDHVIALANAVNDDGDTTRISIVDAGTLSVELSPSTPDTMMVLTGSSDNITTEYKLRAEYEDVNITKIVGTTVATTDNDDDIAKVYLYADGAEIASTTSVISGVATFNFSAGDFVVPAGETVALQFRIDLNTSNDSLADTGAVIQFSINDFNADIEAQGTTSDIYASPYSTTGVTFTDGDASSDLAVGISSATQTALTVDDAADFDVGNVVIIDQNDDGDFDSGDEYALITATNTTTDIITVVRGVAGTTALTTVAIDDNIIEQEVLIKGNTAVAYANYPILSVPTQPSGGQLNATTYEVLKFTVTPVDNAEDDLRLEEVIVKLDGQGGLVQGGDGGWYITTVYLYKGNNLVGSVTQNSGVSGDITIASLDSDVDGIVTEATTFTVKATVALTTINGVISAGDFMKFSIDGFGTAPSTGPATDSDFDWIDMEGSAVIQWVDTELTEIVGPEFNKTT